MIKKVFLTAACLGFSVSAIASPYAPPEAMHLLLAVQASGKNVVAKVSPYYGYTDLVNMEQSVSDGMTLTLSPDTDSFQRVTFEGLDAQLYAGGVITFFTVDDAGYAGTCQQDYKVLAQYIPGGEGAVGPVRYVLTDLSSSGDLACGPGTSKDNVHNVVIDSIKVK